MITPAVMIIKYLGGAKRVSLISQCHVSAVYKWAYPFEKREGKGGIIPAKYQVMLLNYARDHGIDLRPEDFFYPERLQKLMQEQCPPITRICKSCGVDPTVDSLQP
ncbi:hypothetical protein [Bartonella rattimassiliensis]|uniref:Uncharacterized protein n=1 Tax=Bartonella rattimassiliensis 15908 TaxID=1094556 RepID=J1JHE5_9HYPH|nr:hypothetical protein [Bartonella rattimassiliensis]EJF83600.1 hypothetical protein MCY_01184 [Bartonella rattimassiliensis 15908]